MSMDKWETIIKSIKTNEIIIKKSYKCITQNRSIGQDTVRKHLGIIISSIEDVRRIVSINKDRFTQAHKNQALKIFWELRDLLVKALNRHNIQQEIPHTIEEPIQIDINIIITPNKTQFMIENIITEEEVLEETNMAQTNIEFINTATRLIPEFDGKPENLRSFLDALSLVDTLKGNHESLAVSLIKTKLKGNSRNLLDSETTIQSIIEKLTACVKGETIDVISAKIFNIKQSGKSANTYCNEIETLTKSLESAYIADGIPCSQATKYSTQVAVKAMTKNCTIDRVKLIMEAGQFNSMNEAIGKFVGSCTEATGQHNTILHFGRSSKPYHGNRGNGRESYRGGHRGGNYRGGNRQNNRRYNNNNGNRDNNSNYRGNRNRNNYNRQENGRTNNVRITNNHQEHSENSHSPLRSSQ